MSSISSKLIKNFLIVIIATIFTLDILMIIIFQQYYYNNRQTLLTSQIESSIGFYNKYFSSKTLIDNIYNNVDVFWSNTNTQVEILDDNGNLLMDSVGIRDEKILNTPDIDRAINGESGRWIGKVDYYHSNVMIVSHPIIINEDIIGVMRVISPLEDIDNTIKSFIILFLFISIAVIIIGIILSVIMAKSIIDPINEVTEVAKDMANGNLEVRSNNNQNKEITQLSNTLNYMATEIQKRERLKNDFISSVSHELRTPLTAIKGWVITLNDDITDKETLDLGLNIIENETDRLTGMVEELLDFSKLVSGIVNINRKEVEIKDFINHIDNYMTPRANMDRIKINIEVDENIKSGYFDYNKIKQVLINVLDNSVKFSSNGDTVVLKVLEDSKHTIFKIIDTGCGISNEDLPRVKEKFYKGKNSKSKNGIGLSICDEIIKMHHGEFNIKSELGKGTIVTISLPSIRRDKKVE